MTADLALDVLNALERQESTLLGWGIVDAALSEEEVVETIHARADAAGVYIADPLETIDEILARGLLIRLEGARARYRTRMAETVRLMANLRQLFFPQGGPGRGVA